MMPIDSREKLIAELGDALDGANESSWPYVDLTDQSVDVHVNRDYCGDECEEDIEGHELVEVEPVSSREAFNVMERFADSRPEAQRNSLFDALNRRHPFSTFRYLPTAGSSSACPGSQGSDPRSLWGDPKRCEWPVVYDW